MRVEEAGEAPWQVNAKTLHVRLESFEPCMRWSRKRGTRCPLCQETFLRTVVMWR